MRPSAFGDVPPVCMTLARIKTDCGHLYGRSSVNIILAALALAQIHTGGDLLRACTASDTAACDAFIQRVILGNKAAACWIGAPASDLRGAVITELQADVTARNGDALTFVDEL